MSPRRRSQKRLRSTAGSSAELTAEADRFASERIRNQLSTEPTDEPAAEELLHRIYATAGLAPPRHMHWLDGPLELIAVLGGESTWGVWVEDEYRERVPHCVWDDARLDAKEIGRLHEGGAGGVTASIDYRIQRLRQQAETSINAQLEIAAGDFVGSGVAGGVWRRVASPIWDAVRERVGERLWRAIGEASHWPLSPWIRNSFWGGAVYSQWHSIRAYDEAPTLARVRFFDEYFKPNEAGALARFSEQVSGYWLGQALALLVRRPRLLTSDDNGRLHGETARCVEYGDGWGFWTWHGVGVPEKVILAPDELTRDDFLNERNVEARRVIQERMGARFVPEIGGKFIDGSRRGVLYEIELPGDPDHVARYLQVQDPSTGREYYLRVPPDTATAEEAAAWTFGLSVDDYRPKQES
jgi:hypothetical protein